MPAPLTLSLASLAGRTGRGVRVAVIDSGVRHGHPHVGDVVRATAFDDAGRDVADVTDWLGHGTAVAAVIREKAPEVGILSAKVFDRALQATGAALVAAIDWAIAERATFINLSLGTENTAHAGALEAAARRAAAAGATIVAAAPQHGRVWLPGAFADVVGVELDWACPRDACVCVTGGAARVVYRASGYPRPVPGVAPERNLKGHSFAVANVTGLLALAAGP